jgi:transposase
VTSPGPGGSARPGSGQAVRREVTRCGRQKPCLRIARGMFAALGDTAGVMAHRPGALERVLLLPGALAAHQDPARQTESRMTAVVDELGLTALVTSIAGLSAVGAAAILAETGDPCRFATGRALDWHAGLAPTGETVRRVHRPDQADRPGPSRAAAGGMARGLGSPAG